MDSPNPFPASMSRPDPAAEGRIFRYFDGDPAGQDVTADPRVLWRRLGEAARAQGHESFLALYDRTYPPALFPREEGVAPPVLTDAEWATAAEQVDEHEAVLAGVARTTFTLRPLADDGSGLTEDECLLVLRAFLLWRSNVKKKSPASLAISPSSAGPPAESPGDSSPSSVKPRRRK